MADEIEKLLEQMPKLSRKTIGDIHEYWNRHKAPCSPANISDAVAQAQRELLAKEGWRKLPSEEEMANYLRPYLETSYTTEEIWLLARGILRKMRERG